MTPKLVIFDCDGVLVDSERISNRVLAENLTRWGLEMDMEGSRRRFQGRLLADIAGRAEDELGRSLPPDWPDVYERERDDAFRAELRPVPGAREAVQAVRAGGARVCVASQGRLAKSELTLSLTGLRELFAPRALFSAEMVARGKPHPDLFLHAAATIGVAAADCAVVEDSPSGVAAASAAGMRAVAYSADSNAAALAAEGAAEVVPSMLEVPAALGFTAPGPSAA